MKGKIKAKRVKIHDGKWGIVERNAKSKNGKNGVLLIPVILIDKETNTPLTDAAGKQLIQYCEATKLHYAGDIFYDSIMTR